MILTHTNRIALACFSLLSVFLTAPLANGQEADQNCNGIFRKDEKTPTKDDCVDYTKNKNSCIGEFAPRRPCDDYVAPQKGQAADCSNMFAPDIDGDLWGDSCDNCPAIPNADQVSSGIPGIGYACNCCDSKIRGTLGDYCKGGQDSRQPDADRDGVPDSCDNCPSVPNADQDPKDGDKDGIPDACDNCKTVPNPNQKDSLGNGIGDACRCCLSAVRVALGDWCVGGMDARQPDQDRDGVPDACDNCPAIANADQADSIGTGIGDSCNCCLSSVRKQRGEWCSGGMDPRQPDQDRDGRPDYCIYKELRGGGFTCGLAVDRRESSPMSVANSLGGLSLALVLVLCSRHRRRQRKGVVR